MRRALIGLGLAGLLACAFLLGFELSGHKQTSQRSTSVVQAVRAELAARYYRSVPDRVLQLDSVQSMISALNDPYTEYLDDAAYQLLRREIAGSYTGIGATLLPDARGLLVVGTQPGPARRAGIKVGDLITRIGGEAAAKLGVAGALAAIGGPLGSSVGLDVLRGKKLFRVEARRAVVAAPSVTGRSVSFGGRTYGYIRVASFRTTTAAAVALQLQRLERGRVAGYVLDLRANPGGLFDQAVAVTSLFLRRGTVVSLEGAHHPREVYGASGHPVSPSAPLAVLVDRYSASSAEVVAAALHDHKRAVLVGEHTFGKAVVQSLDPLVNGGALALTTARYFTPKGDDISRTGVHPDVRVAADRRTRVDDVLVAGLSTLAAEKS